MNEDNFLWLEDIHAERALDWVSAQNDVSLAVLQGDERYEGFRQRALDFLTDNRRMPLGQHVQGKIRNFWQGKNHIKGVLRETSMESYATESPDWVTVLDIDALAAEEGEDWVYKGQTSLGPNPNRCLIHLSRGGSDAVEIREFDFETRNFVTDGFFLPEAKTQVEWIDEDHLLVGTDFGEGSLTTSGYARTLKNWQRDKPLTEAELVFEAGETDMLATASTVHRPEGDTTFVMRMPSFFQQELHLYDAGKLTQVPVPLEVDFRGLLGDLFIFELRDNWSSGNSDFKAGELISIHLEKSLAAGKPIDVARVFSPDENVAIKSSAIGSDAVYVFAMDHVDGKLFELRPSVDGWSEKEVNLPDKGSIDLVTNDTIDDVLMVTYESFTVPPSLYLLNHGAEPELIKSEPARFDASGIVTSQYFATSKDGTRVPYYVISKENMPMDGSNPTVLHAYGGFEVSLAPAYMGPMSSSWLEAGGVWVQANLRGGGEYGPDWHNAALLDNRQRAYDDHIAVAEDLIERRITSAQKLGIRGGSNGGLLVTAVMVQRPELYGAVICAVPLIDMLRYHKLSAGASWMAEYGDPDIPGQAAYISEYSPYQNVRSDKKYPKVFFWTNMKDDRVHPSHARRMAARMLAQGHEVLYFENTEGGHGGGADPVALAHTSSLELVFLMQQLMD
jgi:prolyl oligopeptidase